MQTLGLDPSLTGFGWCIHDSEAVGPKRVVARGRITTSPKDVFVSRYMYLRDQVAGLLDKYPNIRFLGVESTAFGETWSEGAYGLFLYVNEAIYTRRRNVMYVDPVTVKLLAKGDSKIPGKMFKSDMINAALADTGGVGRWSHDEADAYIIARSAARFWLLFRGELPASSLTPAETHVFTRTHTFTKGKRAGQSTKDGLIYRENDRFYRFSEIPNGSQEKRDRKEK